MTIGDLVLDRSEGSNRVLVSGTKEWLLESIEEVTKEEWEDRSKTYKALKFLFTRLEDEGKAYCFKDCRCSLHPKANLTAMLEGLLGHKKFKAIKDDDEKIKEALNKCEGRNFLLTTRIHTSESGKESNKWVAVSQKEEPEKSYDDDPIPF